MIVILTHGIAMPRGTDNATCHTQGLDTWHFYIFLKKVKKKLKFKKKSKKPHIDTWHVDLRR